MLGKRLPSLFCATFRLRRLLNEFFYDGQQFSNGAYFFFDTALKHPDKGNTLGRKCFLAQQELQH